MPTWAELLKEVQMQPNNIENNNASPYDNLRQKYLYELHEKTGRNVIAYYSSWLTGRNQNTDINDSDITGFMNAINGMNCNNGLDIILHTPGGNPTATEGIVKYLNKKFNKDIRVIVPQMAMSAGTMLACSAKEIIMGTHSCLGPIDPQFNGIPAYNILQEYKDAKKNIENDIKSKEYWKMQLDKYPPAFFYTVNDAINLSSVLTNEWLCNNMFSSLTKEDAKKATKKILKTLNVNNKSHSRHFTFDDCKSIGLNVISLETDQELQDLVLSVHHSFIITIGATNVTKIIENQMGNRYLTIQNY